MSIRTSLTILFALGCGLVAAVLVNRPSGPAPEKTVVVSAKRNLRNFEVLTRDSIEAKKIRTNDYRSGVHIVWPEKEEELEEMYDAVCDRTVLFSMFAGDLVTEEKLASKDAGKGLAAMIPVGMRAVGIDINKAGSLVGGFILPRNRVDILAGSRERNSTIKKSYTILEYVEVLAVDQLTHMTEDEDSKPSTKVQSVTVLLSPEDAETLEFYKANGSLTLSLRNPKDKASPKTSPEPLVPEEPAVVEVEVKPPVEKKRTVYSQIRTLRGTQWGNVKIQSSAKIVPLLSS